MFFRLSRDTKTRGFNSEAIFTKTECDRNADNTSNHMGQADQIFDRSETEHRLNHNEHIARQSSTNPEESDNGCDVLANYSAVAM